MPKIIKDAKDKIIQQAKYIIEHDGYEKLTIRKISDDTDVSIGTIYNYFPDKSALDYELMSLYWDEFVENIDMNENASFYQKLKMIYNSLKKIIQMFTGVVTEFYKQDHKSLSKKHRNKMFEELSVKLSLLLEKYEKKTEMFDNEQLSRWITMNMVMMCHMNNMEYKVFENIIKKIFEEEK
jgi:AcrR family transcriptional regulator